MRELNRGIRNPFERFMIFVHDILISVLRPVCFATDRAALLLAKRRRTFRERDEIVSRTGKCGRCRVNLYGLWSLAVHLILGSIYDLLD